MVNMVGRVHVIHIPKWRRLISVFKAIFGSIPFQVAYFRSKSAIDQVNKIIADFHPDHIYNQLIRTAPYVRDIDNVPKTIDYMDAFSLGASRRMHEVSGFWEKWFWRSEANRLRKYELEVYGQFDQHTIIASRDREIAFGEENQDVHIISNGIKVQPAVDLISKFDIGFLGNMGYFPNQHAVEFLMSSIYPRLKTKYPNLKVIIGGANPSSKILSYANDNVKVTGYVERMEDIYKDVKIMVAPIFQGSGLQNKLLEAMAARAACVTTTNANAALGATPNVHLMIADDEDTFCRAIDVLLSKRSRRKQIVDAAYLFVKENYDWNLSNQKLNSILSKK